MVEIKKSNGYLITTYRNEEGKLHRDDGPAVIKILERFSVKKVILLWFKNGILFNDDKVSKIIFIKDVHSNFVSFSITDSKGKVSANDTFAKLDLKYNTRNNLDNVTIETSFLKDGKYVNPKSDNPINKLYNNILLAYDYKVIKVMYRNLRGKISSTGSLNSILYGFLKFQKFNNDSNIKYIFISANYYKDSDTALLSDVAKIERSNDCYAVFSSNSVGAKTLKSAGLKKYNENGKLQNYNGYAYVSLFGNNINKLYYLNNTPLTQEKWFDLLPPRYKVKQLYNLY